MENREPELAGDSTSSPVNPEINMLAADLESEVVSAAEEAFGEDGNQDVFAGTIQSGSEAGEETGSADVPSENVHVPVADEEFDPLLALTNLLIGGAIEGSSQLVKRLRLYEEELRQATAESGSAAPDQPTASEDELVRLRYVLIGLLLDAQSTFRRSILLWARAMDQSLRVTNRVTRPVTRRMFPGPIQRRIDRLADLGEATLANWIANGREAEPHGRELAKMTYLNILNEFIDHLAENRELQDLVTQQSIGLAGEARDEVRERTVTADNLMEGIVRRILRRTPRKDLPAPPPEVQRWANMTLDEYKFETTPKDRKS